MATRTYTMKRRAKLVDETRNRIVDAALELHGRIGPLRTSYAAIAELAGVERRTVYNHFPSETELFKACASKYQASNPFPDPEPWRKIADPELRLRKSVRDLYAHYEATQSRWENILRDAEVDPRVREGARYRFQYLDQIRDVLLPGWHVRGKQRVRIAQAIRLALDFNTWRCLCCQQHIDNKTAAELMVVLVRAIVCPAKAS